MDEDGIDPVLARLQRLGPDGSRAADMLMAAAEQIERPGVRASNLIAFCTREALMSLLDLGGKRKRDMTDAARKVVETAKRLRESQTSPEALLDATQTLEAALAGSGPHNERLERVITGLARRAPARAEADLLDSYVEALADLNNALHGDVTLTDAVEMHKRAVTTVGRLFGPMTLRLGEIDQLAAIADPTVEDVLQLAQILRQASSPAAA